MKRPLVVLFLSLGVVQTFCPCFADENIFIEWLPKQNEICAESYKNEQQDIFREVASSTELDPDDDKTRQDIARIHFLHKLFTSNASLDTATGGWLEIPYFWHWITPNERHSITYTPTQQKLVNVLPPARFSRYKSRADIDRIPSIYFSDLVAEEPLYEHPGVGKFKTFGWCSEREMSYSALLTLLGYKTKIVQEGPHVFSEVLLNGRRKDGSEIKLVARIDNTYDKVDIFLLDVAEKEWDSYIGRSSLIKWYNKMARDPVELKTIATLVVSDNVKNSITTLIEEYCK